MGWERNTKKYAVEVSNDDQWSEWLTLIWKKKKTKVSFAGVNADLNKKMYKQGRYQRPGRAASSGQFVTVM